MNTIIKFWPRFFGGGCNSKTLAVCRRWSTEPNKVCHQSRLR